MKKGIWYAIAAYGIWGIFPIYWKFLSNVPPVQIMTHRVIWSFIFVFILVSVRKDWSQLRAAITRKTVLIYALASVLLAANWLMYIWGVNSGFIVETSLGYFMNPLVNVLLGVLFLGEKMRPMQWVPIGLAGAAVVYMTVSYGVLPWIALGLACTFGTYGFVKKKASLGSLQGLTLETSVLVLPSLAYLLLMQGQGTGAFGHVGVLENTLLVVSGLVTAIPLLLFADAARRIPLSMMGIIQFLSPTLQFLLGVLVYGETFSGARIVGFSLIWLALLLYTGEGFWFRSRSPAAIPAVVSPGPEGSQ
jgi:chloramphenicol-sensitive protein RarD